MSTTYWQYETTSGFNFCTGMRDAAEKPEDIISGNRSTDTNFSWTEGNPPLDTETVQDTDGNYIQRPILKNLVPLKVWDDGQGVIRYANKIETDFFEARKAKIDKIREIDKNTRKIFDKGFTYDNRQFMLDLDDSHNFLVLYLFRDHAIFRNLYPIKVQKTDFGTHELADAAAVEAFFLASVQQAMTNLFVSRDLKEQVQNAPNKHEVEAITDPRK